MEQESNDRALLEAAQFIAELQSNGMQASGLPAGLAPKTVADAHRIQDMAIRILGLPVAGWKVAVQPDGTVMRGAILQKRVWSSPAHISVNTGRQVGVEPEIAFVANRDIPARLVEYTYEELRTAMTAKPVIELIDTRYSNYSRAPLLDRTADFMSNGGLIIGSPIKDWRDQDLASFEVALVVDEVQVARTVGGHALGDPFLAAVALVNEVRHGSGLPAGTVVTTGTYTGLNFIDAAQTVTAFFSAISSVQVTFFRKAEHVR